MTDEEIQVKIAEAIQELAKQLEKQNQILNDMWQVMARRM